MHDMCESVITQQQTQGWCMRTGVETLNTAYAKGITQLINALYVNIWTENYSQARWHIAVQTIFIVVLFP